MPGIQYGSPPPYYGAGEERPLLSAERQRGEARIAILTIATVLLVGIFIGVFVGHTAAELDSPVEWDRLRLEYQANRKLWDAQRRRWEREHVEHEIEVGQWDRDRRQLRVDRAEFDEQWAAFKQQEYRLQQQQMTYNHDRLQLEREQDLLSKERGAHELEKLNWRMERASWARDRDNWEHERRQRHESPYVYPSEAHWDNPQPGQCHSYGKRQYSARLWDIPYTWGWLEACEVTPVKIHGVSINRTDRCENRGFWGGMVGQWIVDVDEPECMPHFGEKHDVGCLARGSGMKRIEAQIIGIKQTDDWESMCNTTPTTIDGTAYSGPTFCINKVHNNQKIAVWDHPDPTC